MTAPDRLLTCRYWALGPACPNIAEDGREVCSFAHFDTGKLASALRQRGTCIQWRKGTCNQGHACYWEHRDTGVSAMYQDDIELDGMNLEIADAAYQAGFDTANHHALFDLIYAVRRIGLRGSLSQKPLPPRHKIYPDRYRPSGYGDNTCRKRKRSDNIPSPVLDSSRRNSELDRCRRKEKKGLRNFAVKIEHASKRGKTADDPISVESDPGTEQSAKRPRKQYSGGKGREFEPQGNTVDRVRNGSDLSQPTGFAQIKSPCFTASLDNLPNSADPNSRGDSVLVQNIDRVKYGMRDTYERMSYCMILMEEAFEKSGNLFFENDTMQILRLLSDIITSIKKDAKLGHKKIEHIRGYVLESHRGD